MKCKLVLGLSKTTSLFLQDADLLAHVEQRGPSKTGAVQDSYVDDDSRASLLEHRQGLQIVAKVQMSISDAILSEGLCRLSHHCQRSIGLQGFFAASWFLTLCGCCSIECLLYRLNAQNAGLCHLNV